MPFKIGDRVVLDNDGDSYMGVPSGTFGTVTEGTASIGSDAMIRVAFDGYATSATLRDGSRGLYARRVKAAPAEVGSPAKMREMATAYRNLGRELAALAAELEEMADASENAETIGKRVSEMSEKIASLAK